MALLYPHVQRWIQQQAAINSNNLEPEYSPSEWAAWRQQQTATDSNNLQPQYSWLQQTATGSNNLQQQAAISSNNLEPEYNSSEWAAWDAQQAAISSGSVQTQNAV